MCGTCPGHRDAKGQSKDQGGNPSDRTSVLSWTRHVWGHATAYILWVRPGHSPTSSSKDFPSTQFNSIILSCSASAGLGCKGSCHAPPVSSCTPCSALSCPFSGTLALITCLFPASSRSPTQRADGGQLCLQLPQPLLLPGQSAHWGIAERNQKASENRAVIPSQASSRRKLAARKKKCMITFA